MTETETVAPTIADAPTDAPPLFERVFVINLRHRGDRLKDFMRQWRRVNTLPTPEVWPAIHGDRCPPPDNWVAGGGAWGCYRSHLAILEHCIMSRVGSYLVFEDDAKIADDFDETLTKLMVNIPSDWWQVYIGGQLMHARSHPPLHVAPGVYRPFNVNRTHGFAVARPGMVPMYQHLCRLPFVPKEHIDHHLGRWHEDPATKVYCPDHWIVGQHGSRSDISGRHEKVQFYDDARALAITHWLYDSPVCVLYRGSKAVLNDCLDFLHGGDTITTSGYDVTLQDAVDHVDRVKTIARWFGWVRSEIATGYGDRIPVAYHPQITAEDLQAAVGGRVVEVDHVATRAEVLARLTRAFNDDPHAYAVLSKA